MYVLTRWTLGSPPNIEIDAARYGALKDAVKVQRVALGIEEKLQLVIANYEEFEREILTLTLVHMVRHNPDWSSMSAARLLLDRRIVNLLSTCRLYVDQIKHSVGRSSTHMGCTYAQAEKAFSEQYDKNLGYRIMEALRNHVQHHSLAIGRISYPGKIETGTEDDPLFSFGLDLKLDIEALHDDKSFKVETLKELELLPPTRNDIILFVRQYVEGLGQVQEQLRQLIKPAVDKADAMIDAALMEWQTAGHDAIGLAAANLRDDSTAKEHIAITGNWKEKRVELEDAHSSLVNFSRRFVSNVRPRDAYPPFPSRDG